MRSSPIASFTLPYGRCPLKTIFLSSVGRSHVGPTKWDAQQFLGMLISAHLWLQSPHPVTENHTATSPPPIDKKPGFDFEPDRELFQLLPSPHNLTQLTHYVAWNASIWSFNAMKVDAN